MQKDFVLEAPQIAQAKACGADIILLIAAILSPEKLLELKNFATSLGLGVLVEVHDESELARIQHLDFQVLGINSRDLKTFRTALNRVNVLRQKAAGRLVIAESGVRDHLDFQAVRQADGFLIGTGLMRTADNSQSPASRSPIFNFQFSQFKNFKISKPSICKLINLQISESPSLQISKFPNFPISKFRNLPIFKACGIRSPEQLHNCPADLLGINFSPLSKRRFPLELLDNQTIPANAVAVFYKNSEAEIREILEKFKFGRVQVYAGDLSPEFVKTLRQRVILACALRQAADLDTLEAYAPDVDFFILDAAVPGSGERIGAAIPPDFPYPFLLAGGLNADNLHIFKAFENCIGIDVASGIETAGALDLAKVEAVLAQLKK